MVDNTQSLNAVMSSPTRPPQTPSAAPLMKPPMSEMHPSKVHPTMAAPSSALRLGFTDIKPSKANGPALRAQQSTPSKSNAPSSPFDFQFARNTTSTESGLGPDAQRMMNEIREEAARIKAELVVKREKEREDQELVNARKIAQPKGKAGRYSDIHMAEFKKMDSIENHASSFRATPGRFTPASSSKANNLKRTQSKANLDDDVPWTKTPAKLTSSKSSNKLSTPGKETDASPKRVKQQANDDVSTNRPISCDNSNIPRPKTPGKDSRGIPRAKTFAHMLSPTQASLARAATATKTPTAPRSILKSPSKVTLTGLKKSATASNLLDSVDAEGEASPAKLRSPSRFDKVKSIFAKHRTTASTTDHNIPKPVAGLSKTPAPSRTKNELPAGSFTTPGKKHTHRVDFTPAPKHAALAQNSPSPVKSGIPRSNATNSLVNYPSLDAVVEDFTSTAGDTVMYPDLSGVQPLPHADAPQGDAMDTEEESPDKPEEPPVDVPGTFTFRSDHTIRFGSSSPKGFGGHSGQASVRHVRPSILPSMPGAFPLTNMPQTTAPRGKENVPPYLHKSADQAFNGKAFPHGVGTKKRYRVEDDEEEAEREAAEHAAKKRKSAAVPEGEALMAPRLTGPQKGNGIRSPSKIFKRSPMKSRIPAAPTTPGGRKATGISMSRLAYLAQPKQRK